MSLYDAVLNRFSRFGGGRRRRCFVCASVVRLRADWPNGERERERAYRKRSAKTTTVGIEKIHTEQ